MTKTASPPVVDPNIFSNIISKLGGMNNNRFSFIDFSSLNTSIFESLYHLFDFLKLEIRKEIIIKNLFMYSTNKEIFVLSDTLYKDISDILGLYDNIMSITYNIRTDEEEKLDLFSDKDIQDFYIISYQNSVRPIIEGIKSQDIFIISTDKTEYDKISGLITV